MIIPVVAVVGFVNLLAKNFNYNINIPKNPDFDVRVRRDLRASPLTPIEIDEKTDDPKIPASKPQLLSILKGPKQNHKSKRDTYQQYNNNDYTTNRPYDYNGNNGAYNTNNNNGLNANSNQLNIRWKTKPNFFARAYNALADTFGTKKTTPAPARYSYNNAYNNNGGNNNNPIPDRYSYNNAYNNNGGNINNPLPDRYSYNNAYNNNGSNINNGNNDNNRIYERKSTGLNSSSFNGNQNNGTPNTNNGFAIDFNNFGRKKSIKTEATTQIACIYCFSSDCPVGLKKIDGKCIDVNSDFLYE